MMYDAIRAIHNSLKSLAAALLSFVMLMQLVKITPNAWTRALRCRRSRRSSC